jgi:hypothetical protein
MSKIQTTSTLFQNMTSKLEFPTILMISNQNTIVIHTKKPYKPNLKAMRGIIKVS